MSKFYQEAEEFIKDIFWAETHDKDNNLNLEKVVADKLIEDNKNKDPDYYNHRQGVVHVSSLAKCLRGVVYEMLGAQKTKPVEPRQLGVFRAGIFFEEFIVDSLGTKMLDRQTEYIYKYKNLILTGRDDGTIEHEGIRRILEAKSVHSDSFWYREKEGTLVASHNQMQLETYLYLRRILPNYFQVQPEGTERKMELVYTNMSAEELIEYRGKGEQLGNIITLEKPDNSNLNGFFSYVSKDDCTVIGVPVKFNQRIIDETVLPALDFIAEAFEKKDPNLVPTPALAVYSESRGQWQKNWLATYCDYHDHCAGAGWLLEAQNLVTQKNKEQSAVSFAHTIKKVKPQIEVVGKVEPTPENNDAVKA